MPDLDYESEYSLNTDKLLKEGIPAAYLMTNDVDAMSNWLNANSQKLSPQAKSILEARIGSAKYFKDLRNSKSTNKKLPDSRTDLYVEGGRYVLKNISLTSNQTSSAGCGSTVLEMMLKSRGLNVAQEHIRSFRSNKDVNEIVNENYELDPKAQNENGRGKLSVTKNYNDDEYIDITSRADVITEHLPNTAMRAKEYSVITANSVKKEGGTDDIVDERQVSNAILLDVRDAIGIHKSPVGLLVNNHYLTVVGVDVDSRELLFEDSLSTKELKGYQMTVKVDDIVASIRTADNGGKEMGTIQISWVEDMHPDLNGNLKVDGFSEGYEYKNNQFIIPEKNDALIKNDYYVKNSYQLNKIDFGDGFYVNEKIILPKQLDKEEAYKKPNEVGIYREHNKEQFNILPHAFVPQENTLVPFKSEAKKDIEHLSLDQITEHDPDVELSEINEYIPSIPIDVNTEFIDAKKKLDELNNEAIANALAENNQPISQPINNNVPKEEIKPQPVKQQPIKKEEPKKEVKAEPKKEVKAEPQSVKKEEIKPQPAKKEKLNPQPAIQPKSQWFNASEEETDDLSKINMEGYMDEIIRLYNRTKGLESAEMNVTYAGFDKACRNIIALSETLKAQKPRFADAFYMYPKEAQKAIKDVLVSANTYLAEFNKRDSDKSIEELSDVQQERLKTMASINCLSAMVANQVRFNSPEGKQFRLATKITNAQCIIGAGLNYREDVLLKNTVSMSNPKSYLSLVYKLQQNPDFNEFTKGGVLTDKEMSKLSKTKGFDLMDKYGDFSRKMDKQREKERQNEPELML